VDSLRNQKLKELTTIKETNLVVKSSSLSPDFRTLGG
jgi:hypothetical protein